MNIYDARILVFTVDCWNRNIGTNTMYTLFSWCKPENLANVYIRADLPTYSGCENYFQIRENDVIRSICKKGTVVGSQVIYGDGKGDEETAQERARYEKFRNHRPWLFLYLREVLWKMGTWKSASLKQFLDEFKPDIIFFPYEGYIHFNRLVRFTIDYTHAQAAGYFWDDNFTYKQRPYNLGYRIYRFFQRRDLKKSVLKVGENFAITPKTKKEADEFFGISCSLLSKPIFFEDATFSGSPEQHPIRLLYTGNLGIGRFDTIKLLSGVLDRVNASGEQIVLDIYTATPILDVEKKNLSASIRFHSSVKQESVLAIQKESDILLFVEDLKGGSREIARLSFSTKLTDYFAAGKCILALAAADIAPMEYLTENDAALVATDEDQIEQRLKQIVETEGIVREYAEKAWDCGYRNHNAERIIGNLKSGLQSLLHGGETVQIGKIHKGAKFV